MLDGSVHVGNQEKYNEESLTKLELAAAAIDVKKSNENVVPAASAEEIQNLEKAVTDLKWKLKYEQGLHKEMVELL